MGPSPIRQVIMFWDRLEGITFLLTGLKPAASRTRQAYFCDLMP